MSSFSYHPSLLHLVSREEVPQRQIIDNILHLLDSILDRVDPLPQDVVLEVEHLEAGVEVLDEGADPHRQLRVAEGHRVHSQAAELVDVGDEGQQVVLDGDVEGVAVFEVDGH